MVDRSAFDAADEVSEPDLVDQTTPADYQEPDVVDQFLAVPIDDEDIEEI